MSNKKHIICQIKNTVTERTQYAFSGSGNIEGTLMSQHVSVGEGCCYKQSPTLQA